jgi:predicted peroxiredoxin
MTATRMSQEKLMIMLTTGPEDRGNRATLAFSMGVAAKISGVDTTIFMTMSGTVWSRQSACAKVHINGFDPLEQYVRQFHELGGNILVCSPCHDFYCAIAGGTDLIPGAELAGLTHVVDQVMSASTVTL